MIAEAVVAWESVALVTALLGGGSVAIVKIVKVAKNGKAVTEDRVRTLCHDELDPRCDKHARDLTEIKESVARVETRTEDIWSLLKDRG